MAVVVAVVVMGAVMSSFERSAMTKALFRQASMAS